MIFMETSRNWNSVGTYDRCSSMIASLGMYVEGTYVVFGQRFAQMQFVRVDQQGAVVISIGLTQLGGGARDL